MKKKNLLSRTLPLAIASFTLLPLPATASEWVRVKTNSNNDIYSVDAASIEASGRIRNFWSIVEFGKPITAAGKQVYSSIYYISVDCQSKVYGIRFMRALDQNSQTIKEQNFGDRALVGKAQPGSSEEASIKYACSRR